MNQSQYIISKFAFLERSKNGRALSGARIISNWLGLERTAVYKWTYIRRGVHGDEYGGTVPKRHHDAILQLSQYLDAGVMRSDLSM
jgi:hypothetical protein